MGVLVVSGDERRAAVDGDGLSNHRLYTKMHAFLEWRSASPDECG